MSQCTTTLRHLLFVLGSWPMLMTNGPIQCTTICLLLCLACSWKLIAKVSSGWLSSAHLCMASLNERVTQGFRRVLIYLPLAPSVTWHECLNDTLKLSNYRVLTLAKLGLRSQVSLANYCEPSVRDSAQLCYIQVYFQSTVTH